MVSGKEDLTTAPDKRVESAGIFWVERGKIIKILNEGKKTDEFIW